MICYASDHFLCSRSPFVLQPGTELRHHRGRMDQDCRRRCRQQVAPEAQVSASPILGLVMRNLFLSPWGVDKNNLIIFFVPVRPLSCPFPPQFVLVHAVWCCWRGHRAGPVDEHVAPEPQVSASPILGRVMCNLFLSPWGVDKNN